MQGKTDQAIALVQKQSQKNPKNPEYLMLLAGLLFDYNDSPDKALELLDHAQKIAPENPYVYTMRADFLVKKR